MAATTHPLPPSTQSNKKEDNSTMNNTMNAVNLNMTFAQELIYAVLEGAVQRIRELLSQVNQRGRHDGDIQAALLAAAHQAHVGNVEVCRLLWEKLSMRGKKRYRASKSSKHFSECPLMLALQYGRMELVRLFVQEFKFNVNQKNINCTPLCMALELQSLDHHVTDAQRQELALFLLENGAKVNHFVKLSALTNAVQREYTELVRILLVDYRANATYHDAETALLDGNAEILRMLLEHGAVLVIYGRPLRTSLSKILVRNTASRTREMKLAICQVLCEHAQASATTAAMLRVSCEDVMKQATAIDNNNEEQGYQILLEAGMDPKVSLYCAIRVENLAICQRLVQVHEVDAFLQNEHDHENESNDDYSDDTSSTTPAASSPFVAAARLPDTTIFEYLLAVWNERFLVSNGGKNGDGDYPLHVACCDPFVSLQAVQLLVNRQPDALSTVDGEQGLLPLHFAAMWDASLDVIFVLLQHHPEALLSQHRSGNDVTSSAAAAAAAAATASDEATNASSTTTTTPTAAADGDTNGPRKKKAKTGGWALE
jgi:hypothetical protein